VSDLSLEAMEMRGFQINRKIFFLLLPFESPDKPDEFYEERKSV